MDFSNRLSIGVGSLEKAGNVIVVDFHEEGVYFCIFSPGQREWFLARKDDDGIDRQVATYETILKGIPNMMQEDVQNYLLHGIAFDWDVLTAFHHFGFLLFFNGKSARMPGRGRYGIYARLFGQSLLH